MGTRSTTTIIEKAGEKETPIMKLYIQYDGYPDGVGLDLANFSKDMQIVNGFSRNDEIKQANGAGCFAAQLIASLKKGIGNVYVIPLTDGDEEYNYKLIIEEKQPVKIRLKEEEFDGTANEFYEKYSKSKVN